MPKAFCAPTHRRFIIRYKEKSAAIRPVWSFTAFTISVSFCPFPVFQHRLLQILSFCTLPFLKQPSPSSTSVLSSVRLPPLSLTLAVHPKLSYERIRRERFGQLTDLLQSPASSSPCGRRPDANARYSENSERTTPRRAVCCLAAAARDTREK
jgi:hypothetical protein